MSFSAKNGNVFRRVAWGILVASSLFFQTDRVFGQSWPSGSLGGIGRATFSPPGMLPRAGMSPYAGMPQPIAVNPASGWNHAGGHPGYPLPQHPFSQHPPVGNGCYGGNCYGGYPASSNPEDELSPLEEAIKSAAHNAWFRLEYLNWSISDLGRTLLGAPAPGVANQFAPFLIGGVTGQVFNTTGIAFKDNNGLRGTIGIPLVFGEFELSAFLLGQGSDGIRAQNLPTPGPLPATSVSINGVPSATVFQYDNAYRATFKSDVWGAEANVILDTAPPGEGLKIQPLVGFRYLFVQEQLRQEGSFNALGTIPLWHTVIDSQSANNLYGLNLGFRMEFVHRWLTLGIQPKVTLGANTYQGRVTTERFVTATEPTIKNEISGTNFAPIGEFSAYGRFHVSETTTLFVSYNLLTAAKVMRPHKSINYNVNAVGGVITSAAFTSKEVFERFTLQGITVGAEIRYR